MPASFPGSAKVFIDKADLIDIINAVDVNDLQNEVAAIEAEALNQTGVFITTTKTNTATAKSTPVDADAMPMLDSAAGNILKKLTWAYLKSNLKTYNDTLYSTLASMSAANAALLVGTTALTTLHSHQSIVDGWVPDANTWTYFNRSQAFTNDLAIGVAVVINMVDTTDFVVGSDVTVTSSAGSENTYVTAVVVNTSITVNQCVLNHTTTSRLVTLNNVFTISGDQTAVIQKGALLKWTQTTVKCGVVFSSTYSAPNTYIVIMLSTDYPLTNAAISLNYFSYLTAPAGWPSWFNFDAAPLGFSALPAAATKYSVVGKTIMMNIILSTGTSNATTFTSSTPCKVALAAATVNTLTHDNSANLTTPARTTVATNTRTTSHWSNLATGAWTNSGTKGATLMLSYEW
jgi:hypothetical protein